eukprot:Plantae.Rhodophyta-Rhodochaete_pulchella.ctg3104.p2 GENE.Plantae.Rhodophyta-Rhodochaete_pulchella.ctg3104~~Plantae.Rhodophyta-Rhodochaete_pulchella.ctg3104.p2  ORF type:complete len:363 (-),score=64.39 Plantae.Rhodophyta-Rhodochaete_pulchella.ctg3104:843-1931(-)
MFEFEVEDRIQCGVTSKVRYTTRSDNNLSLEIPLDAATNRLEFQEFQESERKRQKVNGEDKEEPVKLRVPLSACLQRFASEECLDDFFSSAISAKTSASKTTRIRSFPPYLLVHLRRYYVAEDWTPKKLDVLVDMDEKIDLEFLRGTGQKPGEELLPEEQVQEEADEPTIVPDTGIVAQLVSMGFSENGSKRAAIATGNTNAEASMEWVFAHMNDADFNDPLPAPKAKDVFVPAADSLSMLSSMGFSERHATGALKACDGNLERAADWLFSRTDNLDSAVDEVLDDTKKQENTATSSHFEDGPSQYELVGFASHMGSNTACGHYVAHLKKDGRWILFNDGKVAVSQEPPLDLGYLYLFRQIK